jgi:hypothetical protein
MATVLDQLNGSTLSLQGNGLTGNRNVGNTTNPSWGYADELSIIPDPYNSKLQNTYSVDGSPNEQIIDFNRQALGGVTSVKLPSILDELDPDAPNNYQAGTGGVVSQIYKSAQGQNYRDLGPSEGRY